MMRHWMTLLLALLCLSCRADAPECSESQPCAFGSYCVEGVCVTNSCTTSAQCPMEQHCMEGSCVEGCFEDDDCYPGDYCEAETSSCEAESCVDSHQDCARQEFCNAVTGDCFEASGYYCMECNGNTCYGGYCSVTCETRSDCPSGYECIAFIDLAGDIQRYGCYSYCWLYEDESVQPVSPEIPECLPSEVSP